MNQDPNNTPNTSITSDEAAGQTAPVNQFEEAGSIAAEASRKLKRKIIIALVAMVAFAAIAIPLISLLDGNNADGDDPYKPSKPGSVIFYTPDYDRLVDIRKDPDYLNLDRDIYLVRGEVKKAIPEDRISSQSPAVQVLYQLVQALIDGDADAYNALFSERYAADPDMLPLEAPFTMQRIYDIVITEVEERSMSSAEDGKYTEYLYKLEYKISRNDGTYRVDIGHDTSGSQYFQLSDREGTVLIDALRYIEGT